ncbi:carotenoid ester lipase precursor [Lentinus tigrinus ALCF2SS1-7]|uniref:Carboxylic ester hydrolase n=1 Tax=Lentinus tigrinus ALCF2SS1-6 TaxID=1328759 RepID=A0A5C2S6L4_9APHY|nr:carotenoid ester lipase precursor [Lentinus tigrinus ALCF2SS1-6]RPD69833.1 carotenoid ester lipase precursor [Lentinus tigrinus ALCF2SS1-7]
MVSWNHIFPLLLQILIALNAIALPTQSGPSVHLDQATVTGTTNGSLDTFLGIPYAQPPVGNLRLQLPQLIQSYTGNLDATKFGNQCLQQAGLSLQDLPPQVLLDLAPLIALLAQTQNANVTQSEDCLYLNIIRPANVSANAKLPVLFWIYGGGFADGSNGILAYNGTTLVQRSIELNEPVIYVALNYRLNVFGFLGGKEVKQAGLGNLGLQDQRAALRWVNKFISAFGGDPSKVTIWGESAGSISVFLHLFANGGNTEGLFRAGMMSSGFSLPTGDITEVQDEYDFVVNQVGCSNARDTLACLRTVPADQLQAAANNTPAVGTFAGLVSPFLPRADGRFVTLPPMYLPLLGTVADVPVITGDVKDEATLFSLGSLNITTDDEFASYVSQYWFPGTSPADLSSVLLLYPSDPAAGSPFDTGSAYALTPQYKRIAALQGDWFFNGPRRQFLDRFSATRTMYNFLSARGGFPDVGDFHGSDTFNALGGGDMGDYFIRFINHLNPNAPTGVQWPPYRTSSRSTLQFNDGSVPLNVTADIQRLAGTDELTALALLFPL